ncbi:MAG: hydrogenase small subunit [Chloroflexi bacterium]|nr:hydrogenase small subunit [Chloroflexota bacterium]
MMANSKEWSRRDFLRISGGSALALSLLYVGLPKLEGDKGTVHAAAATGVTEVPVIWLQTGSCSGCSVSILNSLSPRISNVLLDEVVPGKHISLRHHATIMAGEGDMAMQAIKDTVNSNPGGYVLVVDGAISTKDNGVYCEIGEENGVGVTALEHVKNLGKNAMAVIALGTCAAYGGIPAATPNTTGCVDVTDVFRNAAITTPVINVPGCPPHPDWFVGTVATILLSGLDAVKLDQDGRPLDFYGKRVHDNCPREGYFSLLQFSKKFSDPYCMYELGCKGPLTFADCPKRLWNSGNNWCVGANSLCTGCVEDGYPDKFTPFKRKADTFVSSEEEEKKGFSPVAAAAAGVAAGAVIGAAVGVVGASVLKKSAKAEQKQSDQQEKTGE